MGFKGVGVYISRTCFRDGSLKEFPDLRNLFIIFEHKLFSFEGLYAIISFITRVLVNAKEAVAPSRHDSNNVDCDVKPQNKQIKFIVDEISRFSYSLILILCKYINFAYMYNGCVVS